MIADREAYTILECFRHEWISKFGVPKVIVSDQEGAFSGEQGAVFCERLNIHRRLKAKGQHAQLVEKHHDLLRAT